ncbi:Ctr copper transporter [Lepidopterella palustris CBS 459.81]|uniref:Copper transport protein n=1 Tax=Lepidopterella palustris CBS 459.81 TaxID=1314670 RepID=A0A8E2EKW5_9PEZI|nr:Ctr copper transporter [Lepidopterella palustris CBS 459.81]
MAKSWHITSKGMFAGTCIGITLLVMVLELFRRLAKEYDRLILQTHIRKTAAKQPSAAANSYEDNNQPKNVITISNQNVPVAQIHFRPTVLQQMVRALLHMIQFAIAYLVMLLAMYYNGYLIISIFIGSYIGSFIFSWESISIEPGRNDVTVHCG